MVDTKISFEQMQRMTFWSRHDPIRQPKGNTDHWAKYRQRTGNVRVRFGSPRPITSPEYDEDGLRGNPPGNYGDMRQSAPFSRTMYNNSYHDRAREGFRYWLIERPKPTKFGKYGMGSYKTVLGIGNAPRT